MTDEQWLASFQQMVKRQRTVGRTDAASLRTALAEVSLLMMQAPTKITDSYYDLAEGTLAARAVLQHDLLDRDNWAWPVPGTDPADLALGVAFVHVASTSHWHMQRNMAVRRKIQTRNTFASRRKPTSFPVRLRRGGKVKARGASFDDAELRSIVSSLGS